MSQKVKSTNFNFNRHKAFASFFHLGRNHDDNDDNNDDNIDDDNDDDNDDNNDDNNDDDNDANNYDAKDYDQSVMTLRVPLGKKFPIGRHNLLFFLTQ